jgi:hypothetical protein
MQSSGDPLSSSSFTIIKLPLSLSLVYMRAAPTLGLKEPVLLLERKEK